MLDAGVTQIAESFGLDDSTLTRNTAALQARERSAAPPLISIVVPFYQFDAAALCSRLAALALLADGLPTEFELLFADDGSPDARYSAAVWQVMANSPVPAALLRFHKNQGRAIIRNRLARAAAGEYLLYLDADMMPDEDDYMQQYLRLARLRQVDIVYGGRSAKFCTHMPAELQLHRRFTEWSESVPVAVRETAPAYHFYSCNFMARRVVLDAVPLDEKFVGWGWEDIEWAARACEKFSLLHIDNPATHLGLLQPAKILAKYDESVGNFLRMLALRPAMLLPTNLYKTARLLSRVHAGALMKPVARTLAVSAWVPMRLRVAALSVYKAALYSAVV